MSFNARSPAVKRLMREAQELKDPTELYTAQPLEDNIFEWHFTIRGPKDSDFDGGIYHGRILLPAEYPMKPPSITFLTPNGRFKTNEKICLSISGHHPETWLPSWSIRTALLALIGFMPTFGEGALGSLDYTSDERKILAKKSVSFKCQTCHVENNNVLLELTDKSHDLSKEAKELAAQIDFKNKQSSSNNDANKNDNNNSTDNLNSSSNETIVNNESNVTTEEINKTNNSPSSSYSPSPNQSSSSSTTTTRLRSESRQTNSSSIILFILCAIFFLLFIRRLYIMFGNGDKDVKILNKEL